MMGSLCEGSGKTSGLQGRDNRRGQEVRGKDVSRQLQPPAGFSRNPLDVNIFYA